MYRRGVVALSLLLACGGGDGDPEVPEPQDVDMYDAVNPFIGTGGLGYRVGSTYPGPALPFAMAHPGPDTRSAFGAPGFSHCAGYWYEDTQIEGFSMTRMNGTGVPDYGVPSIMPVDGMDATKTTETGYADAILHDQEEARPGYYSVVMGSGIRVEISSTVRAAIFRITFPDGADPVLLMDLEHTLGDGVSDGGKVDIDAGTGSFDGSLWHMGQMVDRIGGMEVFMAGDVQPAPTAVGVWNEDGLDAGGTSAEGIDLGGWLQFAPGTTEVIVRVGVSFTDADGARGNLAAEIDDFDLDRVAADAEATWRDALGAVELTTASERDATMVATGLYRTMLMPTLMTDADGRVRNVDYEIVTTEFPRYNDFSFWDTYRTLHPWLLLMEDTHNADFVSSLMAIAAEGGAFPRWGIAHGDAGSMIGSPADMVIAESAVKGVSFDEETAYQYSRTTSYGPAPGTVGGRGAATEFVDYGYVPSDLQSGSVAKTMEYAIADNALHDWALRLGHDDDAADFGVRAGQWQNLYDDTTGFIRPMRSDGQWDQWADPTDADDAYTEGNAWQYVFMVPHDLDGLAETMGGREAGLAKARELFEASEQEPVQAGPPRYYWHGNEPDIIAPWVFAALGSPVETYHWVDWVLQARYGDGPDGLPGNDDGGTMSAWILFAASGIYPIAGTDRYILGYPRQPLMVLHRAGGTLRIEAGDVPENPTSIAVTLDGAPVDGPEIAHDQIAGDHVLRFEMQ